MKEKINYNGEEWERTHKDRIGRKLPYQNGRQTPLPDYIEFVRKDGAIMQINPEHRVLKDKEVTSR